MPSPIILKQARFIESPNQDERPEGAEIDLLVIHNISLPPGEFGGPWVQNLFLNQLDDDSHPYFKQLIGLEVSSHLYIRRDGELIQFVPLDRRAWHAGASCYRGRERCNDFSIGIELEGTDDIPYSQPQYRTLAQATHEIMRIYPGIVQERIAGHADISPGRKTDPGESFDWPLYRELLNQTPLAT